ncbi:MAG: prepilin-type N-terminal cleavage/methylation domain-containing protein [Candidatus Omnitrophica bacterium]|nr:prepilin-type N-terminal cleavage/methylation domain-containing protein [Candidatus Omnitrophota bacterium]MCA9428964.1 prepilin-type N-terminal cleavage/methylation domain-containing protein [Candidatus Omnitrophota bacterium]MCB9768597.1 prepilin-type N-terminal cleavage/methylation domain-containing protein [Candidatus Omnitrophota bacterium]MCB9784143.1 prepilin-type N-terminal cleavage/methylation domain-containing protein [Candidatus Omnitrophota bacterium]
MTNLGCGDRKTGFTLIELLITIAIILILIAIALPNFLEAQVRAKVVRAESDMRSLSIAMESYYLDRKVYPYQSIPSLEMTPLTDGLRWLTSPIAYMTALPVNPFSFAVDPVQPLPTAGFNYKLTSTTPPPTGGVNRFSKVDAYYLSSYGPDFEDDTRYGIESWPFSGTPDPCAGRSSCFLRSYSPTNGSRSVGDLYRFGGEFKAGSWCLNGTIIRGRDAEVWPAWG